MRLPRVTHSGTLGSPIDPTRAKETGICRKASGSGSALNCAEFNGPGYCDLEIVVRIGGKITEADLVLATVRLDHPGFGPVDDKSVLRIVPGGISGFVGSTSMRNAVRIGASAAATTS